MGVRYKGLVFCRNNGRIMENMDKELTVPKLGADNPAESTPNASNNFSPIPKVQDYWKKTLWLSVVRDHTQQVERH